jgi:hypothetical protein
MRTPEVNIRRLLRIVGGVDSAAAGIAPREAARSRRAQAEQRPGIERRRFMVQ